MVLYTPSTPLTLGSLGDQVTVKALRVKAVAYNLPTSQSANAVMSITLSDPNSGFQETIGYQDISVWSFWTTLSTTTGMVLADIVAQALLKKLLADGKLPPGTITVS